MDVSGTIPWMESVESRLEQRSRSQSRGRDVRSELRSNKQSTHIAQTFFQLHSG